MLNVAAFNKAYKMPLWEYLAHLLTSLHIWRSADLFFQTDTPTGQQCLDNDTSACISKNCRRWLTTYEVGRECRLRLNRSVVHGMKNIAGLAEEQTESGVMQSLAQGFLAQHLPVARMFIRPLSHMQRGQRAWLSGLLTQLHWLPELQHRQLMMLG